MAAGHLLIMLAAAQAAPPAPRPAPPAPPSAAAPGWRFEAGPGRCLAAAPLAGGGMLALAYGPHRDDGAVLVADPARPGLAAVRGWLTLRLGGRGFAAEAGPGRIEDPAPAPTAAAPAAPAPALRLAARGALDAAESAGSAELLRGGETLAAWPLPADRAALAALRECVAALPGRPAAGNLAAYFGRDDYPAAAIRAGEQGIVDFRLDIGADGRVAGCAILRSSGSPRLDAGTCRLLRSRARFAPARDAAGAPVPDSFTGRIEWRLPD